MGKTVNEQSYKDLVTQVFTDLRLLLNMSENVPDSPFDLLEHAFGNGEPLNVRERETLEHMQTLMESLGSDETQQALKDMIDGHRLLVSITGPRTSEPPIAHPFFQALQQAGWDSDSADGQTDEFTFVAYDLKGRPVASQTRNILFSDADVMFDYETLTGVRSDLSFLSFSNPNDNRLWTVVRPDAKWTGNVPGDSILDSLLLTVLFLGNLSYFPNTQRLTYFERIGISHTDWPADYRSHGFSIPLPSGDGWVPLVARSTDPQDGNTVLELSPAITAQNAGPALAHLIAFAEMLKQSGIVLDVNSLMRIEVEPASGLLRLPVDARPVAHDAGLFSHALENQSNGGGIGPEAADDALYTPSFSVYSFENGLIFKAIERQNMLFLSVIDMLAIKSGRQQRPLSYIKAWDSLIDLHRYYMSREMKSYARIIRKFSETIFKIIRYYVEELGQNGLENFAVQLPVQPAKIPEFLKNPQKWFEFAKQLIDEAKAEAGGDIGQYWADHHAKFWGYGRVLPFRRGGGTPQNPPPVGGGPDIGSTGGPAPSSASGDITGYDEIDEIEEISDADLDYDLMDEEEIIDEYIDDSILDGGLAFIDPLAALPEWAPVW